MSELYLLHLDRARSDSPSTKYNTDSSTPAQCFKMQLRQLRPFAFVLFAAAGALLLSTTGAGARRPHLVFVLTDDLGWNYPGYHNAEVKTPTLDRLAMKEGVRLESSYMYKYCSPSRGSLLTGRYPWKLPGVRCNLIPSSIPEGVPLAYTMLPEHLAKVGYFSAHVGKWHLGFHTNEYTPVARGFNESYGFLEGGEDHYTHLCGAGLTACHVRSDKQNCAS